LVMKKPNAATSKTKTAKRTNRTPHITASD
jgi:hypothetical protein